MELDKDSIEAARLALRKEYPYGEGGDQESAEKEDRRLIAIIVNAYLNHNLTKIAQ